MIVNKTKPYDKDSIVINENKRKGFDLRKIDLISFKKRGLSIYKISKMIGVSKLEVEKVINDIERYKQHSGIF